MAPRAGDPPRGPFHAGLFHARSFHARSFHARSLHSDSFYASMLPGAAAAWLLLTGLIQGQGEGRGIICFLFDCSSS